MNVTERKAMIEEQLQRFKHGFSHTELVRPLKPGREVQLLDPSAEQIYLNIFAKKEQPASLFVPASGMATRMFSFLCNHAQRRKEVENFFAALPEFPFYSLLKTCLSTYGQQLDDLLNSQSYETITTFLLTDHGLGLGTLPKLCLPFHSTDQEILPCWRSYWEEAKQYLSDTKNEVRLHFTIQETHTHLLQSIQKNLVKCAKQEGYTASISYSVQDPCTDSVSVYKDGTLVEEKGQLLWRASGHGALLQNLAHIETPIVFIKNVDNIQHPTRQARTIYYQKVLGGLLLKTAEELRAIYNSIVHDLTPESHQRAYKYIKARFWVEFAHAFYSLDQKEQRNYLMQRLTRPLRVCGLVRNRQSVGGSAFICKDYEANLSPQIVEPPQVARSITSQQQLFKEALYMNPVHIVCLRNPLRQKPASLSTFVDKEAGFITEKTHKGRSICVQELPGLWNGAMSGWNSVFVEIPEDVFAPVKKITDLLSSAHKPCDSGLG